MSDIQTCKKTTQECWMLVWELITIPGSANNKYHNEDGFDIVLNMAIFQKRRGDSNLNIATIKEAL